MCTLLTALKSAHLQTHLPAPALHTPLPSSALKGTSATMLALSSAFPIAAATAIRGKKCTATRLGADIPNTSQILNTSQSIKQGGGEGRARAEKLSSPSLWQGVPCASWTKKPWKRLNKVFLVLVWMEHEGEGRMTSKELGIYLGENSLPEFSSKRRKQSKVYESLVHLPFSAAAARQPKQWVTCRQTPFIWAKCY